MKGCEPVSSLENLTAKILADSKEQADSTIAAAKAQAQKNLDAEARVAAAESEKIVSDARFEAAHNAALIIQGKMLAIRDENLAAKREMLDKVFAAALEKLNNMPKDEFISYLAGYLAALDLDGEEIVLPKKYGITSAGDLNAALQKAGKKGNLALCSDPAREIEGGFILIKKGVEQNNTFEALLSYYRDELESEVLKILY